MEAFKLLPLYLGWHYSRAFSDLAKINKNLYWFVWHFFSVPETFKTLFDPWQRLREKYKRGLDIEGFFTSLIVNIIMRVVGFVMRTFLLVFAFLFYVAITIVSVLFWIFWILLPFILVALFVAGIGAIFYK